MCKKMNLQEKKLHLTKAHKECVLLYVAVFNYMYIHMCTVTVPILLKDFCLSKLGYSLFATFLVLSVVLDY